MSDLAVELPEQVLIDVSNGQKFPVRRVFCVGRNYAEHAREMGKDPEREPPFFFTKWADTVVQSPARVPYPQATSDFHYEGELVVAIGKVARDVSADEALEHVFGYATGSDMTRRDLQLAARDKGRPWDTGKNVELSCPIGILHPVAEVGQITQGEIRLTVNGVTKQQADISDLIWPVADVIVFLSGMYTLRPGDLIYTGTPAGVGPVVSGDTIIVSIAGLSPTQITIEEPAVV